MPEFKAIFYVNNKPDSEGFHDIKDENGTILACACDTSEQASITLEAEGFTSFELKTVYNEQDWDNIGK
jgi:hypothetical protein